MNIFVHLISCACFGLLMSSVIFRMKGKRNPLWGDEYRLHRGGLKSRQKIREVLSLAASAVIAETAAAEEQQDDDQAVVIATSASVTASAESVTAAAEE